MNVLNEEVGRCITKNPQVIDFWVFAAYNEAENNLNMFAARDLFQRCIRINGSSDIKAYLEYFSFELKFVEKMVERRDVLLGRDKGLNVIYGSGEDVQSIQKSVMMVESNLELEDEVMKLKIPQIIYANCLSQYEGKLHKGSISTQFLKALLLNSSKLGGRELKFSEQLQIDIRTDSNFLESLKISNIRAEVAEQAFFTEIMLMKHKADLQTNDYIQLSEKHFSEGLDYTSYEKLFLLLKFLKDVHSKLDNNINVPELSKLLEISSLYSSSINSLGALIIENLHLPLTIELLEYLSLLKMDLTKIVNEDLVKSIKSNISSIDNRFLYYAYNYALDKGLDLVLYTQEISGLIKAKGIDSKKASSLILSIIQQVKHIDSNRIKDHMTQIISNFYIKLDNISALKATSEAIITSIFTFILDTANPDICHVDKSEFTELKSISNLIRQVNKPKLINTDHIIACTEKGLIASLNSNTRVEDSASKKILVNSITKMLLK